MRGKEKRFDFISMIIQPLFNYIGMMNSQIIKNQNDFPGRIFESRLMNLINGLAFVVFL